MIYNYIVPTRDKDRSTVARGDKNPLGMGRGSVLLMTLLGPIGCIAGGCHSCATFVSLVRHSATAESSQGTVFTQHISIALSTIVVKIFVLAYFKSFKLFTIVVLGGSMCDYYFIYLFLLFLTFKISILDLIRCY